MIADCMQHGRSNSCLTMGLQTGGVHLEHLVLFSLWKKGLFLEFSTLGIMPHLSLGPGVGNEPS